MSTLKVNSITDLNDQARFGPVLGTAQATTSGTSKDFPNIPAWVKQITVLFNGVSTNGSSNLLVQMGGGGVEITGYTSNATDAGGTAVQSTAGVLCSAGRTAASLVMGGMTINLLDSTANLWVNHGILIRDTTTMVGAGSKTLSATLDRIRVTTVNGTDVFDAGSVNIIYE
jgi:hypothetical protein